MHITHIETDSLWQEASTNYWFEVDGESYGVNVFEDEPAEEFWTLLDSEGHPIESDDKHIMGDLTPMVNELMFKDWQATRQYVTLAEIAGDIGLEAHEIHETATHGWQYVDGLWIVDLGEGQAWSLVEHEDYAGNLESIERWVFKAGQLL